MRYVVQMQMYVYADNDKEAIEKSKRLASLFDMCGKLRAEEVEDEELLMECNDNKCQVTDIFQNEFANFNQRRVL